VTNLQELLLELIIAKDLNQGVTVDDESTAIGDVLANEILKSVIHLFGNDLGFGGGDKELTHVVIEEA
jgi:hypothetical protein